MQMNRPEVRSGRINPTVNKPKVSRDELAKQIERMRSRDSEMVTGIFKNLEAPAQNGGKGALQFPSYICSGIHSCSDCSDRCKYS